MTCLANACIIGQNKTRDRAAGNSSAPLPETPLSLESPMPENVRGPRADAKPECGLMRPDSGRGSKLLPIDGGYVKRPVPAASRRAVALAAGAIPGHRTAVSCHYCEAPGAVAWPKTRSGKPGGWVSFVGLEIDHVFPEALGGSSDPENLVLACRSCNRRKGCKI